MGAPGIASFLQAYGPWGVVALFSLAIACLWRELKLERRKRDGDARGFHLQIIQMVKESAEREASFNATVRLFAPRG